MEVYIYTWKCHKKTPCVVILKKPRCHYFSFTKLDNRRVEQILPGDWGVGTSGTGDEEGKGCKRVNMVQILCTHVCKWKNDTC
jgi:hypothetical protein